MTQHNKSFNKISEVVAVPQMPTVLDTFKEVTRDNIEKVFGFHEYLQSEPGKNDYETVTYGMNLFLENDDHGLEHIYNVYAKACEIADVIEKETGEKVDRALLYVMIALHDSARFHVQAPTKEDTAKDTERKVKKAKRADSKHEFYGVAQLRFALAKLRQKGINIDPQTEQKIADYVYNHDYMTPQLNGDRFREPSSLEGQIARLADRISTSAITEIERYRATGKRLGTTFYKPEIPFDARKDFTFSNIGSYIKTGNLDQFMFFMTLLAVKAQDFSNPVLQKLYQERTPQKKEAAERIITMAQEEGFDENTIASMKKTIQQYSQLYEFDFQ